MNVYYDFTETGGFPLDQGVLNDEQNGILLVEAALANLLGPLAIISGCVVTGSTVSAGVVAVNGAIMPFTGGTLGTNVIVVPTPTDLTYFSGSTLPGKITQVAAFGDDGVHFNAWADFVSVTPEGVLADVANVWLTGDVKQIDVSEAYITANFDGTGLGTNERLGWAICNGNNGTVNRLGKFPVQRNPADSGDYFTAMGDTGGNETVTLNAANIPQLESNNIVLGSSGSGSYGIVSDQPGGSVIPVNVNVGSPNNPVEVLPPFVVTLFIQKI